MEESKEREGVHITLSADGSRVEKVRVVGMVLVFPNDGTNSFIATSRDDFYNDYR